jgi:hypothetical protein
MFSWVGQCVFAVAPDDGASRREVAVGRGSKLGTGRLWIFGWSSRLALQVGLQLTSSGTDRISAASQNAHNLGKLEVQKPSQIPSNQHPARAVYKTTTNFPDIFPFLFSSSMSRRSY